MLTRPQPTAISSAARGSRLLFVFSIIHHYREMLPVAEAAQASGWQVTALIGWTGESADAAADHCKAIGLGVRHVPDRLAYHERHVESGQREARSAASRQLWRRLVVAIKESPPLRFFLALRGCRAAQRFAEEFLDALRPDAVLQGHFHALGSYDNAILKLARRRGLPCFALPMSPYVGRIFATRARFNNVAVGMLPRVLEVDHNIFNRLWANAKPSWTASQDGKQIFMWDPFRMWAAHLTGLLESDPWQRPALSHSLVFVSSERSRALLTASGYPPEKVVVCGIPLLENVVRRARDQNYELAMRDELGLGPHENFILVNIEPAAEHHYATWEVHRRNNEMLMQELQKVGVKAVLSLHPLCRLSDYAYLEADFGAIIARRHKVYELYPHCWLSLSFPCSTNIVAAMFAKPLIIYDFHGMLAGSSMGDLYSIPGADVVSDPSALGDAIERARAQGTPLSQGNPSLPMACEVILDCLCREVPGAPSARETAIS